MINEQNNKNISVKCIYCKSTNYTKQGYRKTENRGKIQKYFCRNCERYFTNDDGFYRMRNNPQKITCAIDLFYRGVSTRKVQEHFQAFYPHNSTHKSIYEWIIKYSKVISKFTNKIKLNVGAEAQTDEIEFHRRKSHKKGSKGIEKNFFIDSIDPDTKFMLASEYMKNRGSKNIKAIMLRIKERTESQIKVMTTDGWNAYEKQIKKVFGYNKHLKKYNTFHNKNIISEEEGNFNYPIERLHNNVKSRTKTFRGFHGSINSANAIMKGFEIYYNFITKHQAINCTPSELATDIKLNGNKWLDLIHLSNQGI